MSYVHCHICSRAFNLASQAGCPTCGRRTELVPADPAEAVVAAAEQLARAMARATAEQLDAATAAMDRRWRVADEGPSILRAIRGALARPAPASSVVTGHARAMLLAPIVMAVLTRLAPGKPRLGRSPIARAARALLAR